MHILKPGIKFAGKYVIIKQLRVGGMSCIWLARSDENFYVVVKEPRLDSNVEINIEKIRHEAKVLKNVKHANIANLIKAYEIMKIPEQIRLTTKLLPVILVLEYVNGPSLEDFRKHYSLSDDDTLNIMRQLCSVVSYIHRNNIVHRDIKPSNILLQDYAIVKLIDFGTSRYYFDQPISGEAVISPGGYTAPEQHRGIAMLQSDIWSLGAVLYFLLTGKDPIHDLTGYPHNIKYLPDPRRFKRDVDERFVRTIQKAMNPNPSLRYLTADEFLSDLLGKPIEYIKSTIQLLIKGEVYGIDSDVVVIGRGDDPSKSVEIIHERDHVMVRVYDPNYYISKRHCMIFKRGDKWFIKDLGSLNKTAIYRQEVGWIVIHKGYRVESNEFELKSGDVISIVYDESKGPYLQVTVKFM